MTSFSCFSDTQPGGGAGMFSGVPGGINKMTNIRFKLKGGPVRRASAKPLYDMSIRGGVYALSQQDEGKQT